MYISRFWLRAMGLSGIAGGVILFLGDMLFYYDVTSIDFLANMSKISDNRIIISGVTALVATWLYMLGLGQVSYAFSATRAIVRNTVVYLFGAILISYGIVHAAYLAIATSSKLAFQHHLDLEQATHLSIQANHLLRIIVYPLFAVLSIVFIYQVWYRKTCYPRWMVLFFPLLLFLLQYAIVPNLSGLTYIIIAGGYLNILLIIFFTASTIALWKK